MRISKINMKPTRTDVLSLFFFFFLVAFFLYSVRFRIVVDEGYYASLVQRWIQGDRPLVDEWNLTQLFSAFLYCPDRIFVWFTGGFDGIVLFNRILFVISDAIIYWFLYFKLRLYGFWGVISAFLFCSYAPFSLYAVNYHSISLQSVAIVCTILCTRSKQDPIFPLVFAGFVFSCGVIAQPFLAIVYLVFSVFALLNRFLEKREPKYESAYAFLLDSRVWLFFSIGVLLCAITTCAVIQYRSGFFSVIRSIPDLLSDADHSLFSIVFIKRRWNKIVHVIHLYGVINFVFMGLLIPLIILIKRKGNRDLITLLFAASCTICLSAYATAVSRMLREATIYLLEGVLFHHCIPIWFGLVLFLLSDRKDKRIFVFWAVGALFSLFADYASEESLCIGGAIAQIATPILFHDALQTVFPKRKGSKRSRFLFLFVCMAAASSLLWESVNIYLAGPYPLFETIAGYNTNTPIKTTIDRGPFKGIVTHVEIAERNDALLQDLDSIKKKKTSCVFILDMCPQGYVYLNQPYGTYSTWWYPSKENMKRIYWYWVNHPDRRPEYVFLPKYGWDYLSMIEESDRVACLDWIRSVFDCETYSGISGDILYIEDRQTIHGIENVQFRDD